MIGHPDGSSKDADWDGIISSLNKIVDTNNSVDSIPRKQKKLQRLTQKTQVYDDLMDLTRKKEASASQPARKRKKSPKLSQDQKKQLYDDVMELARKKASASSELKMFAQWLR